MNAFAFVIMFGKYEIESTFPNLLPNDNQYQFLIFAPSEEAAKKYCENYVDEEKEIKKIRLKVTVVKAIICGRITRLNRLPSKIFMEVMRQLFG